MPFRYPFSCRLMPTHADPCRLMPTRETAQHAGVQRAVMARPSARSYGEKRVCTG